MPIPVGEGPDRRSVVKVGLGTALALAAGLPAATTAAAAEPRTAAGVRGGGPLSEGSRPADWHRYVQGPASRTVRPVRVLSSAGEVTEPHGLLTPGGKPTVLRRAAPVVPPRWPDGTTVTASSFHSPNNGDGNTPTTYDPANAIDGNQTTFWNDADAGTYPATLTITAPSPVTLPGVTLLSNSDGVPVDFTVQTWDGSAWQTSATVTGNSAVRCVVPFPAPVTTTRVQLVVTADQNTPQGEYTRVNELWPGLVPVVPETVVVLDFGKVVVGFPVLDFAWSSLSGGAEAGSSPGVRLAFSETRQYLSERSDFSRSDQSGADGAPGTDQYAVPAKGGRWTDEQGYLSDSQVYADGLHGFRYLRISLDALPGDAPVAVPYGEVAIDSVALDFSAYVGTPESYGGWFLSSDEDLNRYWYAAAYTNELITDTFQPYDIDPRGADSPSLDGKLVLQDGAKRDRDPYVGDIAVSGRTAYLTHPDAAVAARNVLADLADHQRADGWIPPASINGYTLPLFDYPLWWVTASWDYLLYTGDRGYATGYYPALLKVLDQWYPSVTDSTGLLNKGLNGTGGYGDYAFLGRSGQITYYNANYVEALKDAAGIATMLGHPADAARWTQRAATVAAAINSQLWDASAGAYLDSSTGDVRHAQDGNAIAITAGVADPTRAASALAHLDATTQLPYGNAFMDNDTIFAGASQRVYAFTSYPELLARFRSGRADSAIDQIKRMYGWMYRNDPGITAWEGIGPDGTPYEGAYTSMAHGWSTGVLPALSNELLGVSPTGPGFGTWEIRPRPGGVAWARGRVPTPRGPLDADWSHPSPGTFTLTFTAPAGTTGTVAVPTDGLAVTVRLDGRTLRAKDVRAEDGYAVLTGVKPGRHTVNVQRTHR